MNVQDKLTALEKRVGQIEKRNKRVEKDKAWETSIARKIAIALCTYIVVSLFFIIMRFEKPFINAIVPTIGFLLSTLSFDRIKTEWVKHHE